MKLPMVASECRSSTKRMQFELSILSEKRRGAKQKSPSSKTTMGFLKKNSRGDWHSFEPWLENLVDALVTEPPDLAVMRLTQLVA